MKKRVLISGAGGSLFPYMAQQLSHKYSLTLVDSNEAITEIYPRHRIVIVPPVAHPSFKKIMERLLRKEQIEYYVPLIDEEIPIALELAEKIKEVRVIAPRRVFVDLCCDKYLLMKTLSRENISSVKTWLGSEFRPKSGFPVFVKPRMSRGSRGAQRIDRADAYNAYFSLFPYSKDNVIVQELLEGVEYTVSVVVNNFNHLIAIVPKRVLVKKGITLHAVTEKNKIIETTCRNIVATLQPHGPFNVQLQLASGKVKIFEINPRFSTTTVLTCRAGINEFELCIELYGKKKVRFLESFREHVFLYRRWENCFYVK